MEGRDSRAYQCGFHCGVYFRYLREVTQAIFMRRVQPAIDAIDAQIEVLKKEAADFEGRRECLLSSISGPSRFGDQTLFSRLL